MSLTIETEIKDIFIKIDNRLERMEQGQNELKLSVSELKGEVKNLSTELKGDIKALDERLGGQITNLETKVVGTNEKVDGIQQTVTKMSTDVTAVRQDVSDLKGVKSLIIPAVVAILVSLFGLLFRGINIW